MRKIQMVDLASQYQKIKTEIDEAVLNVVSSTAYINGPEVQAFATELQDYLNVKHVIPCANGTDALQVAMMALELKPGDEVITTTFTFIATAEVIALLGLTPVLVDVLPDTMNIDPNKLKAAITPKTKAIVPVHLFGQCADMEEILKIAEEHKLYVIEDTCQALGAEYKFSDGTVKKAGTMGNAGAVSFFPSKNLGCYGDGGAIFTNDDELAARLKVVVNHGMTVRYIHDYVGVNSRLDSIQAAILRIKLRRLDEYNKARKIAAEKYNKAFAKCDKLVTPYISPNSTHIFHQYTLITKDIDRDALLKYINEKGIPAAIYYPIPLHHQKAYLDERYKTGMFPVSEELCKTVISLPMHTELDDEQIEFITNSVLEFIEK
ncbi:DegT/DnrJ/EryC1/StrS family aminotransferase [Bacteroidales bacterium OttesenSCG-928-K03]|nr:DegT/DnrJ/EryC1/StrS family aminotransferase [Odoribacter sp. OttesenSCG-928-L07]MDL2239110.1 DegT/DnrJ/EryC1/StrS family aminotransferase [Bacteroidales bacterium OttesenSCG-928-L14]MDL2240023.1 DegT/DnrJ/EryC1/StrS family aminotransferase [Bacteroidales bacterium OttesenSCG-928-K22]MDL2242265.1 DegT/DnrJ/EryC1/StrS family aminotransferase [Bacteroidales bacterium OttesenSCG-928-K03]